MHVYTRVYRSDAFVLPVPLMCDLFATAKHVLCLTECECVTA